MSWGIDLTLIHLPGAMLWVREGMNVEMYMRILGWRRVLS
jgi:hypothetical protein